MDYIDWIGFYSYGRENAPSIPYRFVVVKLTPPDDFVYTARYRISAEYMSCTGFPMILGKSNMHKIFLVQNNLNSKDVLDYVKQWYDPDSHM